MKTYHFPVSMICIQATIFGVWIYGKIARDFGRISQVQPNL
jgi:hypothetical protein